MTKMRVLLPAALLALVVGGSVTAFGQTTRASLSGVVRDPSGAVVPEVNISVKNSQTGATRETTSDAEGRYSFTSLPPGHYDLRASRTGFKTALQAEIILSVASSTVIDVALEVGNFNEVVEVKEEEPLVETTKAEMSRVVNQQSIESLPIIGRNFVDFAKLSSGVAPGRENTGGGAFKEPDAGVGSAAAPRLTFGGQS
ncbi:MAG TPA: carboxypeptidase-like regulatory domain-containing protein, partial [Pyrinomonadaceae bacterium]|nr:carboxypeptidase-like regulatory domain-containing protein [Pyrinomonadaceae bacterium]